MTKYREIKQLVHAENIVFWHAVQSCIINVPALLILQKPVLTDLVGLKWLTFLCLSATSATLLSNTALQVKSGEIWLSNPTISSPILAWSQWHKALIYQLLLSLSMWVSIEQLFLDFYFIPSVFLKRAPRVLEELGAGFIMLSGMLVPLVKFCTRDNKW